ncbi:MAG: hypothetical protein HON90_02275, partial [Halobacteriovoraceae bacterium]|nr:hypothetical protein [Halobacteriovoraceae bacterium]
MKKSFLLLLAMISLSYYAGNAHAGFLLEPYAGMQFNSTYDVDGGGDGNITGTAVGARVGFQNLGLMLGIDGRRSSWTLEPKT